MRYGAGLIALPLLLACASSSPVSGPPIASLRVTELNGSLEAGVEQRRETRSRNGQDTFDKDDLELEQLLRVNTAGYVYHPRFMQFWAGTEVEFAQVSDRGTITSDDRSQLGGRWRVNFLDKHPFGIAFFGDVRDSETERSFQRTYELTRQSYGTTLYSRKGPVPLELSYTHRSRDGSGIGSDIDEVGDEWAGFARYGAGEGSSGTVEYRTTQEDIRGQDIDRNVFFATNTTYLDDERRTRLDASVRSTDQSDDSGDRDSLSAITHLKWHHSDTFSTRYYADFRSSDTERSSVDNWNFEAAARHRLYGSLESTVEGYGRFQDASFGDVLRYGGRLREDYSKRLGGWGRLQMFFAPHGEIADHRPQATRGFVDDSRVTLADALPVQLDRRDIETPTIVVTDLSGSIPYDENQDYTVTVRGRVVELTRLVTGDIGDGETVLVDYAFQLPGEGKIKTTGINAGATFSLLDWLDLYWLRTESNQDLLSGTLATSTQLEDRQRSVAGTRLSWSWLSARLEFERDDSTLSPFKAYSQELSLYVPAGRRLRGHVSGTNRQTEYDDTDEQVQRFTLIATLDLRLSQRAYFDLEAEYERENWSGRDVRGLNDLEGFGLKAALTWRLSRLWIQFGGRLARIDRDADGEDQDEDRLFLRFRRDF